MMRKIKRFYLYRKIIISFLILNIISITFISAVLSFVYVKSARKELYDYSVSSLARMDSSASRIYESLFPVINYILTDGDAGSFMEQTRIERVGELKLLEKLRALGTANTQFKYVGVANLVTDRYLGTRGVYTGIDAEIREALQSGESLYCLPRQVRRNENLEGTPVYPVLTFVYAPRGRQMNGLIIIDIDANDFTPLLTGSDGGETSKDSVYILDGAGHVLIAANEREELAHSVILTEDLPKLTGSGENYYEEKIGGTMYSIASLKSETTGWSFVSLRPKADILPMMKEMIYIIIVAEAVMIIIDLVITFLLASRIYQPLGTLYKRIQRSRTDEEAAQVNEIEAFDIALESYEAKNMYLEEYKDKAAYMISDYWLRGLARGEISPLDSDLPENCIYSLEDGYYRVLLLSFVQYDDFVEQYTHKDREIIEFALSNILQELIGSYCVNELITTERNCRMVLLKTETREMPDDILLSIKEVQQKFVEYMKILINACYGKCISGWREIPDSYGSAREGRRKALFLGDGCIIDAEYDYGRIHREYPHKAVKSLSEAIVLGNGDGARKSIETLMGRLMQMDVDAIINFTAQACYELAQRCSPEGSPTRAYSFQGLYGAVEKMERMDELRSFLGRLAEQLITERKETGSGAQTKDAIQVARSYIEEHYSDDNLSVEMLADRVGLSPAYFGKLFGSSMNQSCNDYIQEIRMQKAAGLLSGTDRTVNDISVSVGINNTNYFYSLFKKKYGMTPAQYRKKVKEEKNHE